MLSIKLDSKLKAQAQKVAKEIGIPISIVVNSGLKRFVEERRIELRAPIPNAATRKAIEEARSDFKKGKNISPAFSSGKDMDEYLGI